VPSVRRVEASCNSTEDDGVHRRLELTPVPFTSPPSPLLRL
jgi:hypothetical protein